MSSQECPVNRKRIGKIGTTYGLVTDCGPEAPEQIYVNLVEDTKRPIQIDGWVGYGSTARIHCTRQQADELIALLQEATKTQRYLDA